MANVDPIIERQREIFFKALEKQTPAERAAYLEGACGDDAALRVEVERLLQHHTADSFLESPAMAGERTLRAQNTPSESPGTVIGRYKLLQKIGEGGCGVVYMAEQEEPVKRRVALKVIKLGMDTRSVIARFEAERQALALMDHPNIAKVFDAGSTGTCVAAGILPAVEPGFQPGGEGVADPKRAESPGADPGGKMPPSTAGETPAATLPSGRPYFVMELVRGTKITDFCDENKLSTTDRLKLFIQVCLAIQHAHQKGIIHRDIKPSNILVTVNDGVPVPKVIDFGISKATQGRLTDHTLFTAFEQFIGTPAYMSPEQAVMTSLDIDTRSDIYSLGVLLYELLTGRTPFDQKELLAAGLDEMRRTIREVEPVKPSTRLTQELVAADVTRLHSKSEIRNRKFEEVRASSRRLLQMKEIIPLLRGDLDWIVMKCLEKDRARRYETANGLTSDIQRHLNNEPVVACPPSNLYKFRKLVRRNKVAVAAGACVAAALVLGLCIATWGLVREREARKRAVAAERDQIRLRQQAQANERKARTEAATSMQIAQFLESMLAGVGPEVAKGRDTTLLKEILDKTAERLGTELADQPKIEACLRERLGYVYAALGDYPTAELMQRLVLDRRRELYPDGHRDVAEALNDLAVTCMLRGQLSEAETLSREALAMGKKFPATYPGDVATWMNNLATILKDQGKLAEAEELNREALARNRKLFGNEHREVFTSLNNLAIVLSNQDKLGEAEATMREALAMGRKMWGNDHPLTAKSLGSLTSMLQRQGKLPEAEALGREAVASQKKVLGPEHPDLALALACLARVLEDQEKLPDAETLQREALAIRRKALGNDHAVVALSLFNLGQIRKNRGDLPEAEALLRECLAITRNSQGAHHPDIVEVLGLLAEVLADQDKIAEAKEFFEEAIMRKDDK